MDVLLNKLELCLSNYSNNDINELNNRLSNDVLVHMFNSFLQINNNDYTYIVDNLNTKFNNIIQNKEIELENTKKELDLLSKTFNIYKEHTETNIQSKSNELCNFKTEYFYEHYDSSVYIIKHV